jgi:hypothetical protein
MDRRRDDGRRGAKTMVRGRKASRSLEKLEVQRRVARLE